MITPKLNTKIDSNLRPGDETRLYDGLIMASQLNDLPEGQPLRRVILLLTDGVDTKARLRWNKQSRSF